MTFPNSRIAVEMVDREAIRECLYRYTRGIDRLDEAMFRSSYWPDALIDSGQDFKGNPAQFIEWSFPKMRRMDQAQHFVTNILMTVHDASADVESYFYGFHRIDGANGKFDVIASGRYLDRFTQRGDEWRIAERLVVTDWFRQYPDSADWSKGMLGSMIVPGGRFPDDESYIRLALA